MKQLLLIRHAKSGWNNPLQKDFDRPLDERGHYEASLMAKQLLENKIEIDAFYSSPAKRALTTAAYFANAFGKEEKYIFKIDDLYNAHDSIFNEVINKMDDSYNSVALFSHNPGLTTFANQLTTVHINDMPTCSIFAIRIEIKSWNEFSESEKSFWLFDYPKF